jgi:hypothetical protein
MQVITIKVHLHKLAMYYQQPTFFDREFFWGITQRRVVIVYQLSGQPIGLLICCPETSVRNWHCTLRKIEEERRYHLHPGGSLKSPIFPRNVVVCPEATDLWLTFGGIVTTARHARTRRCVCLICDIRRKVIPILPVPVAARSKARVCGRSLAGIVGSNLAGGAWMSVSCECWVVR